MPDDSLPSSETDFVDFTEYISLKIPVACGEKFGYVYIYSHRAHLRNSLLKNYEKELTHLIDKKKYCDSALVSSDIGPTIAIANLIEDGEYMDFVKSFNHGPIQLTGLEHVFKVKEIWRSKWYVHHLAPKSDEQIIGNVEQLGLIKFALMRKVLDEGKRISDPDRDCLEYILKNDNEFKIIRKEILEPSKINKFDGYAREYQNCIIYEDIFSKILDKFKIKLADVETADSITRLVNHTHLYV